MKIALAGSTGMLGSKLLKAFQKAGFEVLAPLRTELDITDKVQIDGFFKNHPFDVFVNCAGFTQVDACEEKSGENEGYAVNGVGVGFLAEICKKYGRTLVHFSSDYVFDGKKATPYLETDPTGPINVYGKTKLMGEKEIQEIDPEAYIIRTSWLFGPNGPNFVRTMAGLLKAKDRVPVVTDQFGGPTYTGDLAEFVLQLLRQKAPAGLYHFANGGYTSWNGFAQEIKKLTASPAEVVPATSVEFVRPAQRPANSRFDLSKAAKVLGHAPRTWQDALKDYIEKELN